MKSPEYGLAICALGLEKVCQNEIEHIGLAVEGREAGRVRFALGESDKAGASQARGSRMIADRGKRGSRGNGNGQSSTWPRRWLYTRYQIFSQPGRSRRFRGLRGFRG